MAMPKRAHAMLTEIRESPAVLVRMAANHASEIEEAVAALRKRKPSLVVFVARGTSYNAAVYGRYLVETILRIPTSTAMPSVTTIFDRSPDWSKAVIIGISQSGRSIDVAELVDEARRQGALTVAITNDPDSPLAHHSALVCPLAAGPEVSVAATKTFTASLAMLATLVAGWGQHSDLSRGLSRLAESCAKVLDQETVIAGLAGRYAKREPWMVTTRGYMLGVGDEAALKLKEICYAAAESLSSAELLHGPIAALDKRSTVVLLLPPGVIRAGLLDLRTRLGERSVPTITFAFDGDPGEVVIATGLAEPLAPIPAATAVHLFAYHMSVARGFNPDRPRGLRKITLTR